LRIDGDDRQPFVQRRLDEERVSVVKVLSSMLLYFFLCY
jgi:hypothetical protein